MIDDKFTITIRTGVSHIPWLHTPTFSIGVRGTPLRDIHAIDGPFRWI